MGQRLICLGTAAGILTRILGPVRPLLAAGSLPSQSPTYHTECWSRVWYDSRIMETARKITVEVPLELLKKAQQASGTGITQTVRTGLQLVAASLTYARLRQFRGKVRFARTLAELKADRPYVH